ncbi:hypothetical protein FLONG3_235 [Fusarium longipes]|uniref:Uncharacterized protein n=1 Tax=Fusarium longipes TaxID=694270 RepID=A0A395TBI4_9HYPO|nr:hypothetical protein FLONG3_235 [Fusarium longipes]
MSEETTQTSSIVKLQKNEWEEYEAEEVEPEDDYDEEDEEEELTDFEQAERDFQERLRQRRELESVKIDWKFGPVWNQGILDQYDITLKVTPSYNGLKVGTIEGSLREGIYLNINLYQITGVQKWYIQDGNQLWTYLDLKVESGETFKGNYRIKVF